MKIKNKKVLVTGADGFIGSHLTEELVRKGAKVKAFVYYNSFNNWGWLDTIPKSTLKKIEIFAGDIRDPNGMEKAVAGSDMVFHLAALIGIPFSYHSPDTYVDTNVKGTLNVLQAALKHRVGKVLHTSTSEVYGSAQYIPIDEKHPINPQSPYAATKSAADSMALAFYRSFDLPVVAARPFNTFGPRQSARAIIPTIISQIFAGSKTIKLGNTSALRDFNYVGNTVEGMISLAESSNTNGEIYNLGSDREVSIKNLAQMIADVTKRNIRIVSESARKRPAKSEVNRLKCDSSKIYKALGWEPKVSLEKGLDLTCQWIKANQQYFKSDIYNI